jgi:hypothetical protein
MLLVCLFGVWRSRRGFALQSFQQALHRFPVARDGCLLVIGEPQLVQQMQMRPSRSWGCLGRPTKRTPAPDSGIVGVWTDLLALSWEGEMKWRVMVELGGVEGVLELREVSVGECATAVYSPETLGLTMAEGKKTLAGLQRHLVQAQTDEHCRSRRRCDYCGAQRPLKDLRVRRLTSLFGVVEVRAPRFGPCRCGVASRRPITPVAEIMPDRCTPEYEETVQKLGGPTLLCETDDGPIAPRWQGSGSRFR